MCLLRNTSRRGRSVATDREAFPSAAVFSSRSVEHIVTLRPIRQQLARSRAINRL
ncbi:hypothetical protein VTJ04DRAFT_574 [Mycothermus thermophilus]|uniref:uncharacterized protein n=1 Tax=Humicola insolens TaxID=85995 RepID=UPI003742680C